MKAARRRGGQRSWKSTSFASRPFGTVRGVRIADRAPLRRGPALRYDGDTQTWHIAGLATRDVELSPIADERLHGNGEIVVVPMRTDEVHGSRLLEWLRSDPDLPD